MLKLFRKKRVEKQPPPPWLLWLFAGFIALTVIGGMRKGTPEAPNKVHEALEKAADELNPKKIINLTDYKNKIFPKTEGGLRMRDIDPGKGNPAVCGQEVSIAYDTLLGDGKLFADKATKDNPLRFRIGEAKVMPVFENGVIGMKEGGKRSLFPPPYMAYGNKQFARDDVPQHTSLRFDITLLSASPELPDFASTPFRIAVLNNGSGATITCGEPARVHLTIWAMDGKKLFTTLGESKEPVSFTPGKSEVFLGLEQGVLGLAQGGARTLIVPPAFQKTLSGTAPVVDFPFPEQQTVLVDVETVP